MNCKNCGNPLKGNAQFCENCGAPVNQESAQTNYGPAPKNKSWQLILILVGVALIITLLIIVITQAIGNKESKNEIISNIVAENTISKKEDEVVLTPATKTTYTVKADGFTYKIPTNLVYETMVEEDEEIIAIGDEEDTWYALVKPLQGAYAKLVTNKNQIQSNLIQLGYSASAPVERTYGEMPCITLECSLSGQNALTAYTKANSMYVFTITILSIDNEYNYDALETVVDILSNAEYNEETTNMKAIQGLDWDAVSKLMQ